eukprot:1677110-Pyramimonas_sp.AAC.1
MMRVRIAMMRDDEGGKVRTRKARRDNPYYLALQSERGIRNRAARGGPMEVFYPGRSLGPTGGLLKGVGGGTWGN